MDEIKDCPFCGDNDPYWDEMEIDGQPMHFLVCRDCQAEGPVGITHEAAAAAWNKRV